MKELRVNKRLRKKVIGYGYKNTREWTQAKVKRIIFIDIFAAIPEVVALIALIYGLLKKMETWELVGISGGMWCGTALVPLCVAIIYYKIIRDNSSVYYEIYKTEQLFYDDQRFCFSYTDFGTGELCTYNVEYQEIEKIIDYPNVNMIEIKGHFGAEITRTRTSVMYNENREREMTVSIGYYYDGFDDFKRTLSEKSGLKFETKDY